MGGQAILTFILADASDNNAHSDSPVLGWILLLLFDGFDRMRGSAENGGLLYPSAPLALFPSD